MKRAIMVGEGKPGETATIESPARERVESAIKTAREKGVNTTLDGFV